MSAVTYAEGALLALLFALGGAALLALAAPLLGAGAARVLLAATLASTYLVYLLARRGRRGGRALALLLWGAFLTLCLTLAPTPLMLSACLLAGLSLLRALLFARGPLAALADLALGAVTLALGVAAWLASGSLALALWTAGLVQAAHVWLPGRRVRARRDAATDFDAAARGADEALARLAP